jgi:hypothetical protein
MTETIVNLDQTCARVLTEGYGSGAWHGPDLKSALADVSDDLAFWRPGRDRHNIAEIALHHAYCARTVVTKITGSDTVPFVVEGDDWFDVPDGARLSWKAIQDVVDQQQRRTSQPRRRDGRRREIASCVGTDFGDDHAGCRVAQAGHGRQETDGGAKGLKRGSNARFDRCDGRVQCIDLGEMQLDHEPMVLREAPMERIDEVGVRRFETAPRQIGEALGIRLTGDERGQDGAPACAQDVGDDTGELQVGVLERFLDPQGVPGDLTHQLFACPGEIAEFLDRRRRHETAANQPVCQQIRDPRRIIHVALASRDIADVHRVGEDEREVGFQHMPHRLPVDAGGFHAHVGTSKRGEPWVEVEQPRVVVGTVRCS